MEFSRQPLTSVEEGAFAFAPVVPEGVVVSKMPLDSVDYDASPVRACKVYRDVHDMTKEGVSGRVGSAPVGDVGVCELSRGS